MKRGFMNSPRYKRAIAADTDTTPSSPLKRTRDSGGGEGVSHQEAMDVSDAGARDSSDAVATAPSTRDADLKEKGKAKAVDADDNGMDTSPDGDPTIGAEPSTKGVDPKAKGRQKAVDADAEFMKKMIEDLDIGTTSSFASEGPLICRIPPRRPGWGRDPEEDILHTVPPSHGGPGRKRCIFRMWPRASDGKPIIRSDRPKGKVSPDGYPWGATLCDFFCVNRVPPYQLVVSYMTGSALLGEMKALGELDAAAPEIEWAESEGEPRDEGVADTEDLVICKENRIRLAADHKLSVVNFSGPDEGEEDEEDENEEDENEEEETGEHEENIVDPGPIPPPPKIPVTSPFHPSHYPNPWPLVPFANADFSLLLQDRVPFYLLPRTLYVHDPFNLLAARKQRFCDTQWSSRPDIVRTYNLSLSESVRKESAEARKKAEEVEEFKARTLIVLRYKRTKEQIKNYEPMIEVPLPPYPRRLTRIDEAHLYISPVAKVGEGHHSIVYKGEWELPRDLFVRQTICPQCFKESADKEIQRLKDTGRWEKMLRAASWGPKGRTGRQPTKADLAAASDPINLEQNGEIIEREVICVVPTDTPPSRILGLLDEKNIWNMFMENRDQNTAILDFANILGDESVDDSVVVGIRINPPFSYESQKNCTHKNPLFGAGPVPRTTKFTVTAKLSLENDNHLSREASNYQQFPDRFFRHYNGYTIIPQLRAVVPVHAIVPQFYGYYKPLATKESSRERRDQPYLSPILLLEHCGQPIDPDKMSTEDQEECISMLLRFQHAGWLHESVFPRNFLVQRGRPTEFPLQRKVRPEPSFRLIDFGRSKKWTRAHEKRGEETEALGMFGKLVGQMAVTLW